jgi:cis-L-3-hydroxyproline dehydratase
MLDGEFGEACEIAMSVLVKLGEIYGADRMLNVENVHIDGAAYGWINDAGLELVQKLASSGGRFRVPATLNPSSIDFDMWQELKIAPKVAKKQLRLAKALQSMGGTPTWTCAPYQYGAHLRFGQKVGWGESNAVSFANTVIGARTERLGDLADVCAAIAGKYPRIGLYLDENRRGQILFEPNRLDSDAFDSTDYGVLGFLVGSIAKARVPVVSGMPEKATADQLKSFCAAAAVGGSVALCHLCGITPEAKTVTEAFRGSKPEEEINIEAGDFEQTRQKLSTANDVPPEVICIGCPHCSVQELVKIACLVKNEKVEESVRFLVFSSRAAKTLAEEMGAVETIESAGGRVIADTCWNFIPSKARTVMTDSVKMAWTSLSKFTNVTLGSIETCVDVAVGAKPRG